MKSLISFWLKGKCPILNGVLFADDSVEGIEPCDQPRSRGTVTLVSTERTPLDAHSPLELTALMPTCRAEDKEKGITVIGGEGGMGSDGFVAITDLSNHLRWIAFFDFSNPFVSVEICGEEVVGTNNLGEAWHFPLENPANVKVEAP